MHTAPPRSESPDARPDSPAPTTPEPPALTPNPNPGSDAAGSPRFSRALLALTAAATLAAAPLAASALGPADSGQSAHSIPVYLISRISHDIGHNDWAFQGQNAGRVDWVASYVALGLFWLITALWIRTRTRKWDNTIASTSISTSTTSAADGMTVGPIARGTVGTDIDTNADANVGTNAGTNVAAEVDMTAGASVSTNVGETVGTNVGANADANVGKRKVRLWLRVLIAAWSVEAAVGFLTLGAGVYAAWTSTPIGPTVLRAADLCSPWWSCVAVVLVVARAERSTLALRAVAGYAVFLAIVLLVPLPGPDAVKMLLLALPAAIPALMTTDSAPTATQGIRPDAVTAA